jgi:hypothetical protein
LENYFTERYLQETGNQITEGEVEQKIDELLEQTYPSGYTSDEYRKQIQQMADIAELLTIYERSPEEAEVVYSEKYSETLTASEWGQMKNSYSKAGLEEMKKIIAAPLPSESQVRSAYRGQAYAHVLNQKFLDVWGSTNLKYSDWRKARFSEVQILNADYFEIEQLTAWFGYDESRRDKMENTKPVVTNPAAAAPATELVQVVKEVTPPELAKEELAEPTSIEIVEETPEQSSNWWLWLIGLLVVVGGLALVLRRKS